ncbi:MAG: methyltransferase domain-containing protein [Candidatus Pacebacteria bacterium]|nr:methyltransferase domain-containing protein [Candidatus Paceibacterota bacterium]
MLALISTILLSIQVGLLVSIALYAWLLFRWLAFGIVDAPFVPTPARYSKLVLETLDIRSGDVVYELGSGDGKFMLSCALLQPEAKFMGVERNPFLHALALARKRFGGNPANVEFRRGDFFATDLAQASKIYTYLLDSMMLRLKPKFEQEFKGRLASRAFSIPQKEPSNVITLTHKIGAHGQHLLFVYDF